MTDESLRAVLDRLMAEVTADLEKHPGGLTYDTTPITIHRHTAYFPASLELLVDSGAITEDEARARGWTPPPPPSRRDRLRWRWQAWRERTGRKLGGWIAGVDLSERNEDW